MYHIDYFGRAHEKDLLAFNIYKEKLKIGIVSPYQDNQGRVHICYMVFEIHTIQNPGNGEVIEHTNTLYCEIN